MIDFDRNQYKASTIYLTRQARIPQSLTTTLVGLHQPSPVSGQAVTGQAVREQDATHWRVKRF